jgi:hypothetical protein
MDENLQIALRVGAYVGIGLFLWSVAVSMDQIARALTKMADARDPKRKPGDGPSVGDGAASDR